MEAKHGNRTLRFRIDAEDVVLVIEDDVQPDSWSEIKVLDAQEPLTALINANVLTGPSAEPKETTPK